MNAWDRQNGVASGQVNAIDQGLRSYMLRVYNYMASGVLLTGIIAYVAGTSPAFLNMMLQQTADGRVSMSPIAWVIMLAPVALVFLVVPRIGRMSTQNAQLTFWAYAGLMGLSLYYIFMIYTHVSILRVLFVSAGTFGVLSIYGYSTKKDLTGWGTFLRVGAIAFMLAMVVNMFVGSGPADIALSFVGVGLSLGFTAYNTQTIKNVYYQVGGTGDLEKRASIIGALSLYADFIFLFVNLLRLMGDRR